MKARLVLLHVVDHGISPMESLAMAGAGTPGGGVAGATAAMQIHEQHEAEERAAAARVEEVAAELAGADGPEVSSEIVEGASADTIIAYAEAQGCDLIVMASQGRGGLKRAVLGSVADRVVRNTPGAAVLVVTPKAVED
jgi:nucleotide-binding universal stress UspA family protein